MSFMEIAIISVMGAGLLGFLGILVQHLFSQNAQRGDDHVAALGAIHEQGIAIEKLHTTMQKLHIATLDLIQEKALATRQHADGLHREAMDAITAQGTRMQELHTKAIDAITALDREHREHREKLHSETMTQIAALSERTAVLETKI